MDGTGGISGAAAGMQYAVSVEKLRQNAGAEQGRAAVALIEGAEKSAPPPVGVHGEGMHINTYA